VLGRIAADDQDRAVVEQREGVQQRGQVLVRALGREGEQHLALAERESLPQYGRRSGLAAPNGAAAEWHDINPVLRRSEQLDKVVLGRFRVGDDSVRSAYAKRHQHTHTQGA
jgi:hypothetical protein